MHAHAHIFCLLIHIQVFHIDVIVKSSELVSDPPLTVLEDIVDRLTTIIVESAQKLPRVEHVLFPDLEAYDMLLPSMDLHDHVVVSAKSKALKLVTSHYPGAQK